MIYSADGLRKDTVALIKSIDAQIAEIEKIAKGQGVEPQVVMDGHGNWPMIPLLSAKATAYNTLVMLQTGAERPPSRGPARRG